MNNTDTLISALLTYQSPVPVKRVWRLIYDAESGRVTETTTSAPKPEETWIETDQETASKHLEYNKRARILDGVIVITSNDNFNTSRIRSVKYVQHPDGTVITNRLTPFLLAEEGIHWKKK